MLSTSLWITDILNSANQFPPISIILSWLFLYLSISNYMIDLLIFLVSFQYTEFDCILCISEKF